MPSVWLASTSINNDSSWLALTPRLIEIFSKVASETGGLVSRINLSEFLSGIEDGTGTPGGEVRADVDKG